MSIELAVDNAAAQEARARVYEDRNIGELCIEFLDDYTRHHSGTEPEVIEAGIRNNTYFILARLTPGTVKVDGNALAVDGDMVYHYGTPEWSCTWDQFSEVGEPYKPWFQAALQSVAIPAMPEYVTVGDEPVLKNTTFDQVRNYEHFKSGDLTYLKLNDTEGLEGSGEPYSGIKIFEPTSPVVRGS